MDQVGLIISISRNFKSLGHSVQVCCHYTVGNVFLRNESREVFIFTIACNSKGLLVHKEGKRLVNELHQIVLLRRYTDVDVQLEGRTSDLIKV